MPPLLPMVTMTTMTKRGVRKLVKQQPLPQEWQVGPQSSQQLQRQQQQRQHQPLPLQLQAHQRPHAKKQYHRLIRPHTSPRKSGAGRRS